MTEPDENVQTTLAETRSAATETGRVNQKLRTRAALVAAAAELVSRGDQPTLADIAERAMVSTTTAYRYFASVDALIEEVFFDREWPAVEDVLTSVGDDPLERIQRVEGAVNGTLLDHERAMRIIVRNALDVWLDTDGGEDPVRPGRRNELIEAALEPVAGKIDDDVFELLRNGLTFTIGPEAMISALDVCGLDPDQARAAARWATEALLACALRDGLARSTESR